MDEDYVPSDLFFLINFILSIIAAIIALIFSFWTIFIFVVHRPCRTINNFLNCNTCVAVIFYSIIALIGSMLGFREDWARNGPLCSFRAYCFNVAIAATCHSKSIHAISRLFSAVFYKYKFLSTWRAQYFLIAFDWTLCFLTCILPFFIPNGFQLEKESRSCVVTSKMTLLALYISLTSCIIPFNIITMVYGMIFVHVHRSTRRVRTIRGNGFESINSMNKNLREIRVMKQMIIQMSILLFGGPIFFFLIIWHAIRTSPPPDFLYLLGFNMMTFVTSIVTVVQLLMNDKMKQFTSQHISRSIERIFHLQRNK